MKFTGLSPPGDENHYNRPLLGSLADSGALIYLLAVEGRVSMDEVRRVMGESVQTHYTLIPPMKHVLCRAVSLADEVTKNQRTREGSGSPICQDNLESL